MLKAKFFLLGMVLVVSACKTPEEKKEPAPAKVVLSKAYSKTMPYVVRTIGNTSPFASVQVRPQVGGEIMGYYFEDGGLVDIGDLLYTIDPRPYEAFLEEALGQYEQAKASLAYNEQKVERYKGLLPEDYVSILDYEQYLSEKEISSGQVIQYEGAVKDAQVNLGYCTIYSPLKGICNRHTYDPGNIVTANEETPLLTINQIDPIYALFTVSEKYFPEIYRYHRKSEKGLTVVIRIMGEEKETYTGVLDFLDNTVNAATGTLLMRAIFPNADAWIWPGQFVHVDIQLYEISNAILVPELAIRRDVEGAYLFVAKEDGTVQQQRVSLGQNFDGEQIIMEGVKAGESVVVQGQLALSDGSHYVIDTKKKSNKGESG